MPEQLTPEQKFNLKRVGSFYFIIDETGNKVSLHGKVFRTTVITKLTYQLWLLREAYKNQIRKYNGI
jgi:hypothetical protein